MVGAEEKHEAGRQAAWECVWLQFCTHLKETLE
jgi:hypothetical protein